jgi:hypothetical protein
MTSKWLLAGALALAACTDTKQIVLSIDTTVGVPCDIDRIQIVAKAAGTTTIERSLKGAKLPISVALLDDTTTGRFTLDVSGFKGNVEVMRASGPLRFSDHEVTETVLLEPKCRANAPCTLADAMSASAVADDARLQCGANVTRYRAEPTLETFVDACTAAATFTGKAFDDGSSKPVRLVDLESKLPDFGFEFYGRPLRQIWLDKDGYISFAQENPDPYGVLVPGPLDRDIKRIGEPPPPQSVMAFWDTLTLSEAGICYALQDSPQRLHVTWNHACLTRPCKLSDSMNNLTFTITLDKSSQNIVLTYKTMLAENMERAQGATATVGLANNATGCPVEQCTLATGLCKDGVTPCGYSQVFSNTIQPSTTLYPFGVKNMQFVPIIDPE